MSAKRLDLANFYRFSLLVAAFVASLAPSVLARSASTLDLTSFSGAILAVDQPGGGNSFAPLVAWTPTYTLAPTWDVVGELGASVLSTSLGGYFLAIEYEALARYDLSPDVALEAGLGAQYWTGAGGGVNAPMVSANIAHPLEGGGLLTRVFMGGSYVAVPALGTYVFRVGVGL